MAITTLYADNFNNGVVDLFTLEPVGTISESGGELTASVAASQGATWFDSTVNAPIGYAPIGQNSEKDSIIVIETRITDVTVTAGTTGLGGIAVFTDLGTSYYQMFWREDLDRIDIERGVNGSGHVNLAFSGSVTNPGTTPHIYRITIERLNNKIRFDYSADDGTSFVFFYETTLSFIPSHAGLYVRQFSGDPAVSASFDYLLITEETGQNISDTAGAEDSFVLLDAGGPTKHGAEFSAGQLIPGPVDQQPGSVGPFDIAAAEDSSEILAAGGADQHDIGIGTGLHVPGPATQSAASPIGPHDIAGFYDVEYVEQDDTDSYDAYYSQGKQDLEGNYLLGGIGTAEVFYYDATQDSWSSPGPDFYGAAQDGYYYYAGIATGIGDFGTLANGIRRTSWMDDQEPLSVWSDEAIVANGTGSITVIADDKVTLAGTFNNYVGKMLTSRYKWFLTGDFDAYVEFENFSSSGGSDGGLVLETVIDFDNYIYVRRNGSGLYDSDVRNNAAWVSYVSVGTADTSGRLRITRTGSTVRRYYWTGSWTELGSGVALSAGAQPMFVGVVAQGHSNRTVSADVFNFTLTSGTVVSSAGWRREVSSSTRGTKKSFPDKSIIVSTLESVDIIDAETDELWMRFTRGTNRALHAGTDLRPQQVRMRDGTMLISSSDADDSIDDGFTQMVDFTMDAVTLHHEVGSTVTGGSLRARNGGGLLSPLGHSPRETCAHGQIASRNNGDGFGSDRNSYQIRDYRSHGSDLYVHTDGYQYRAHATFEGMSAHRWRRWWFDRSVTGGSWESPTYATGDAGNMVWTEFDEYGRLFYSDQTTLYSADLSTVDTATVSGGGAWVADDYEVLPASRSFESQNKPAFDGYDIYLATNRGVYLHEDWPSGTFTLKYGAVDTGAEFEILPERSVTTIKKVIDGGTKYLVVGLITSDAESQVVIINLETNAIFGKSEIDISGMRRIISVAG